MERTEEAAKLQVTVGGCFLMSGHQRRNHGQFPEGVAVTGMKPVLGDKLNKIFI